MTQPFASPFQGALIVASTPEGVGPADPDLYALDLRGASMAQSVMRVGELAGSGRMAVLHDGCLAPHRMALTDRFPNLVWITAGDEPVCEDVFSGREDEAWLVLDANRPGLTVAELGLLANCGGSGCGAVLVDYDRGANGSSEPASRRSVAAALPAGPLFRCVGHAGPNFYRDVFCVDGLARQLAASGMQMVEHACPDGTHCEAVESLVDWSRASDRLRDAIVNRHMANSVVIVDPAQVWIDADVEIGPRTILLPGVHLTGRTRIGSDCRVGPFVSAHDAVVGDNCQVGPFAHLRQGTLLGDRVRIGNFVEVKNSAIGSGSAAGHLSYLGDAQLGQGVNIGAGTITCNYDGVAKHRTTIGDGAFIGSHSTLVAPVAVEDGAWTAAGSVVTKDVPADSLAVGRARQENREGWVAQRRRSRGNKESGK